MARAPYEKDEKLAEIAELCKLDLRFLAVQFLGYQDWDVVHDDVQYLLMKPSKKKALLLPRGHLKSTLVTVAYTIQTILRNPNARVLIANQVWDMSRKFLGEIKAQMEESQLKYLFGEFQSYRWNADDIIVKQRTKPLKEPTIQTTGVESETTGGHFDLIILDDLTGLQNSSTPDQREKTKRYRRSMINLLEPGGTLVDIGCLVAGSKVLMEDGTWKAIEKIKVGEHVVSHDSVETVEAMIPQGKAPVFEVKCKNFKLEATGNHPFLTKNGFVKLEDLRVGDKVFVLNSIGVKRYDGRWREATVQSVTPKGIKEVFDLTVSNTHNFVANGYVVHNTRWHLDDTFSVIFEKEKRYYDIMVRKVVEDGKIIFPKHFSKKFDPIRKDWKAVPEENCLDYIQHLKESMPLDEFLAQYENNPISTENQVFKQEMFKYWKQRPEGLYVGMAVDLAISQRSDADYTSCVVLGMDSKWNIYVLDYMRGHWGPSEIVKNVFDMRSRWHPFVVGMEVNGFQRTLKLACEDEMRVRKDYFSIEEIRTGPERSKENRVKSLEPFYRRGNVFHAIWMKGKDFENELLTFPKGGHDDIIDSMSMCLPLLSPGTEKEAVGVQENSWEWWFQKAQVAQTSYKGFFNRGLRDDR